jgi:hypothetical protein
MNFLEQFGITMILGVLQDVIKNTGLKAALQSQLLGIATDIANLYGYTLTPPGGLAAAISAPMVARVPARVSDPAPQTSIPRPIGFRAGIFPKPAWAPKEDPIASEF